MTSVVDRVRRYGAPPPDLDETKALRELLASKSLYGAEPSSLAAYSLEHLKVARGAVCPRDPRGYLSPQAQAMLDNFDTAIERPACEIDALREGGLPAPYWDAALRGRSRQK